MHTLNRERFEFAVNLLLVRLAMTILDSDQSRGVSIPAFPSKLLLYTTVVPPNMDWTFKRVAGGFELTEGPVWDGSGVLFTDIPNSQVLRYDADSGDTEVYRDETNAANGLKLGPDGGLYACEGNSRRVVRYDDDGTTVVANSYGGHRFNSPNDLGFDLHGRLYFTDPYYDDDFMHDEALEIGHFSVYRADPVGEDKWTVEQITHDTTNPNGVLVSPNDSYLYVAQSSYREDEARELRAYELHNDGKVGDYRVLHNFYPHRSVDGMCLTAEGNIIAAAGSRDSGPGPMFYVFNPKGRVLDTHPYPDDIPTNCCFGGSDLSTLYTTGGGGNLHRVETELTGYLSAP